MRRDNRGFTLIELMLVVAIIGVTSAITVPGLMRARMSANHASAIGGLRAIASAQAVYAASAAFGGYATLLPTLGQSCPGGIEPFLSPDLTWGNNITKSGYFITMAPGLNGVPMPVDCNGMPAFSSYYATAVPIALGETGQKGFAVTQDGSIWQDLTGLAPAEPLTANPPDVTVIQ
jgi:type IV pilus assembly protein PilA